MNEDMEVTDAKDWRKLEPSYPVKVFMTVLYSVILVTGILGNSITIRVTQVLRKKGYLQKNVTDHMVSLACSDLLVLLIGMPVELYFAIWYPFMSTSGNVSCKIYNFLFEACSYATIFNIATLSYERYIATCQPFRYKMWDGKRTSILIASAWVVSLLVALPLLITMGAQGHVPVTARAPVQNLTFCTNLREHWVMYRISIFIAFIMYLIVLIGVAFMCRAMIRVLRKPVGAMNDGDGNVVNRESARVKMARKQTIVFLVLIVASLMVCWLPNQIRRLMGAALSKSLWTSSYFRTYITLHPIADTFFYLSSVLNPFLYNLSSKQFREVFVQVLRCRLTIEHVNKRTLKSHTADSGRSLRPLLLKSLRRSRISRTTHAQDNTTTFNTTQHSDSGVASNTETTQCSTDQSDVGLKAKPNESET